MTFKMTIHTERSERAIIGGDTTILSLPEEYVLLGALDIVLLSRMLRTLAEQQAADLGDELHHADFVVTTDPDLVAERGIMHDCDECRAGVETALRWLQEEPNGYLVVGQLWWAGE